VARKLSSKWTFFNKRVTPVIWLGSVAGLVITLLIALGSGASVDPGIFVFPVLVLTLVGAVISKFYVDLVDEVWDAGDSLLVKNRGREDRIVLNNVLKVTHAKFTNPSCITLTLRMPSRFGEKVCFLAPQRLNPFSKDPIAMDLIARVDAARHR
jgi:hypothetical protein